MTPIQKIDTVLKYLNTAVVWSLLLGHFPEIEKNQLVLIIRKLRDDGYIDLLEENGSKRGWDNESEYGEKMKIQQNFNGDLFCQEGGYQSAMSDESKQGIRLEKLENAQQKTANRLNILTGWIARGTIALFILETVKFVYEACHSS